MDMQDVNIEALRTRMTGIGDQLRRGELAHIDQQRHLDHGTAECAYWHSGYYQALADVFRLMDARRTSLDTLDTSNLFRAVG